MSSTTLKTNVRTAFNRSASHYEKNALLQQEVEQRLLERMQYMKIDPKLILDIGAGTGISTLALAKKYKKSKVLAIDISDAMLDIVKHKKPWLSNINELCADAEFLPLSDHCCDVVFSNMTFQWCQSYQQLFKEIYRVLKPGGLLMFSTLGSDSLKELKISWQQIDEHVHVNNFEDMHDIGDVLLAENFADPVMDVEWMTLTYQSVIDVMKDLKVIGAQSLKNSRQKGLMGKAKIAKLQKIYEENFQQDAHLPLTYEVVYGHAWISDNKLQQVKDDDFKGIPIVQQAG